MFIAIKFHFLANGLLEVPLSQLQFYSFYCYRYHTFPAFRSQYTSGISVTVFVHYSDGSIVPVTEINI